MRNLSTYLSIVLMALSTGSIGACMPDNTSTQFLENRQVGNEHWVRTWENRARFECRLSRSGRCQVLVFVEQCRGKVCKPRVIREFTVQAGDSAEMFRLPPGFRYCLSHAARPVAPACANV